VYITDRRVRLLTRRARTLKTKSNISLFSDRRQKFTENYTGDIPVDSCRIFDIDPASSQAKVIQYVVLGDSNIKEMAQAAPDLRNRATYQHDLDVPILWYCCSGSVADQRNFLIGEVIQDLFWNQGAKDTQILWIPSHHSKINTSFRTDILEVIDGVTKLKEFNLFYETKFTIGMGKSWFAWGHHYDEANIRVEQLNLALDAAAHYLFKCRTVNLTKFTTTDNPTESCPRMRVETHSSFYMDPNNYIDDEDPGYRLTERPLRRMREEIRKCFKNLRVMPVWLEAQKRGDVRPPVMYIRTRRIQFPVMKPSPGRTQPSKIIYERARLRVAAFRTAGFNADMPMLPPYDWEVLRIGSTDQEVRVEPELVALTSPENQILESYVSHMTVTRGVFTPTKFTKRSVPAERSAPAPAERTAPAPVERTAPAPAEKPAPAPAVRKAPIPAKRTTLIDISTSSPKLTRLEDHSEEDGPDVIIEQEANRSTEEIEEEEVEVNKPWAEIMSEEDVPSAAMRRLTVEEKTETTTTSSKRRWRTPSTPKSDATDSDSEDLALQSEIVRLKKSIARDVARLRTLLTEDEKRREHRRQKAKETEDNFNDAMWFIAQEAKKSAKKGGVDDDQSSPQ